MKRILKLLFSKQARESVFWNLKRTWMEHVYWDELRHLCYLVDTRQPEEAKKYAEELVRKCSYLEPETIRLNTISDFLNGDD